MKIKKKGGLIEGSAKQEARGGGEELRYTKCGPFYTRL